MSRLFPISKLGLFFVIPFIISNGSCKRDNRDQVPYVYINLSLDLSNHLALLGVAETATVIPDKDGNGVIGFANPQYPEIILGPGQIINGNGIIIYRRDVYEYEVYDITCTYRAETDYCRLVRSDFEGLYECPCCDSKFLVSSNGYVFQGPAAMPLKQYSAFIANNTLQIKN